MNQNLKGFFDTASQKAGETLGAADAAARHEALRKERQDENKRLLKERIDAELGPIIAVLKTLPEKDGERFTVWAQDVSWQDSTDAKYALEVGYRGPVFRTPVNFQGPDDNLEPKVCLEFDLDHNSRLTVRSTQLSIREYNGHYWRNMSKISHDFETARQELALGLGTFAADRVAEIGEKLGATREPKSAASTPIPAPATEKRKYFWQKWSI